MAENFLSEPVERLLSNGLIKAVAPIFITWSFVATSNSWMLFLGELQLAPRQIDHHEKLLVLCDNKRHME